MTKNLLVCLYFSENEDQQYTELSEKNEKYNTYEQMHNCLLTLRTAYDKWYYVDILSLL